jgi:hypothetical protein
MITASNPSFTLHLIPPVLLLVKYVIISGRVVRVERKCFINNDIGWGTTQGVDRTGINQTSDSGGFTGGEDIFRPGYIDFPHLLIWNGHDRNNSSQMEDIIHSSESRCQGIRLEDIPFKQFHR